MNWIVGWAHLFSAISINICDEPLFFILQQNVRILFFYEYNKQSYLGECVNYIGVGQRWLAGKTRWIGTSHAGSWILMYRMGVVVVRGNIKWGQTNCIWQPWNTLVTPSCQLTSSASHTIRAHTLQFKHIHNIKLYVMYPAMEPIVRFRTNLIYCKSTHKMNELGDMLTLAVAETPAKASAVIITTTQRQNRVWQCYNIHASCRIPTSTTICHPFIEYGI